MTARCSTCASARSTGWPAFSPGWAAASRFGTGRAAGQRARARAAARERCLARVVPGAGPRSEQDQQPRSIRGANRSPLGRIELEERPRRRGDRALRRVDLDLAVDDDDPCPLSHLVLAELLSGIEPDQYRAAVLGVENDRRPRTVRHFDLVQVPGA